MTGWRRARYTKLLAYAAKQPWGQAWRDTLPIAGVDGTLNNRFRNSPLKGKLWAKTGTLNEADALSGYLTSGERQDAGVLHHGEWPPAGQHAPRPRRSTTSARPSRRRSEGRHAVSS